MYPLFETLCVKDGVIQNAEWHQKRYESSFLTFYRSVPKSKLLESVEVPDEFSKGIYKLRIRYNETKKKIEFEESTFVIGKTLKLIQIDYIDYALKYSDRDQLKFLFSQRGSCDDVLIEQNGIITDTAYANIVFTDGKNWFTPATPLLRGTCRQRLLEEGQIIEKDISQKSLKDYLGFNLINAMNDLDKSNFNNIENIFR